MSWQTTVEPVARKILNEADVPGMLVAVQRDSGDPAGPGNAHAAPPLETLALGTDARGQPLAPHTLFPVASITKLATALCVLRLAGSGALSLRDLLSRYLPEAAAARPGVTLRALLSHIAGLPYDLSPRLAPYDRDLDWPTLRQACLQTPPTSPPGRHVLYSNLGPGLCAIVVERLTGQAFRDALSDLVLRPLGIEGCLGAEPPRIPAAILQQPDGHTGTPLESYNSPFWRSLAMPWGGLVTTAAGAIALVRAFGGEPAGFLSPALLADALRDQTVGLGGGFFEPLWWPRCPWGVGVELRGDKNPHWTLAQAGPASYGHAGASGCLVWRDPAAGLTYAILGTRTFESWWPRWPEIGEAILSAED